MKERIYQVDAFTDEVFGGNPAAVCVLDHSRDDAWMQALAAEMNLSETAFLLKSGDGFRLRWFTPRVEVELCGHATLASAHILWETGLITSEEDARFETLSGPLKASRNGPDITMDFPATPAQPVDMVPTLIEALGVRPLTFARSRFDYLIEVATEREVRQLEPNFDRLRGVATRGVMVTSLADADSCDFVSRFFAPAVGVDEDPVTGSAHCCLGPFWAQRLGKGSLRAYQASRRGGSVRVEVLGDRVRIGGRAVTVFSGRLHG